MSQILVTKFNGSLQPYDRAKTLRSIIGAEVDPLTAEKIINKVESKLFNRISTRELYRLVGKEIKQAGLIKGHSLYRLREGLSQLNSLKFEWYLAELLKARGYETQWNKLIMGGGVEHQVDVVAKKNNELWMIEIKHHVDWHKMSGLGQALQVQARLEDILDGNRQGKNNYKFTGAWLINNTKFSEHAKDYAAYKKIRLTGWRWGAIPEESLEQMIQQNGLYPVTILNIPEKTKIALQENNLVMLNDLTQSKKRINAGVAWSEIIRQAKIILNHNVS